MRGGFAAEDGVALHFHGTGLERVVSSRPGASAYHVEPANDGVVEARLDAAYLGAEDAAWDRRAEAISPKTLPTSAFAATAFAREQPVGA
jgi:hypothetical protein